MQSVCQEISMTFILPKYLHSSSAKAGNGFLMGLLVLNIFFIAAVSVVLFLGQKRQKELQNINQIVRSAEQEESDDKNVKNREIEARFFDMGDFTVNLSGSGPAHYVRLKLSFELGKNIQETEMKRRSPQIRDKIITILNSKRHQDLQSKDGRFFLKEEIEIAVNTFLQTGKVQGVYFSTFVFE